MKYKKKPTTKKEKPKTNKNANSKIRPTQYFSQEYLESVANTTPTQRLEFLESFRKMQEVESSTSTLISIRIPDDLLNAFKFKAESQGLKYQTLIKSLMKAYL